MKIYKLSAMILVLLGGCAPEITDWTPAEAPMVNKVDRAIFTYNVHYPAHANKLGAKEKRNLINFLKKHVLSPSSVTIILEEYGGHSEVRIKDIERELLRFGIPYELITVEYEEGPRHHHKHHKHHQCPPHKHHGSGSNSGVEITVERYVVIPPSCANFLQTYGDAEQSHAHTNFGCSVTANLGMMIANPRDLTNGRTLAASDGKVMADGVKRYRDDNVKVLMETSTNVSPGTSGTAPAGGGASAGGGTSGGSY